MDLRSRRLSAEVEISDLLVECIVAAVYWNSPFGAYTHRHITFADVLCIHMKYVDGYVGFDCVLCVCVLVCVCERVSRFARCHGAPNIEQKIVSFNISPK